jgi:hypothetical protein
MRLDGVEAGQRPSQRRLRPILVPLQRGDAVRVPKAVDEPSQPAHDAVTRPAGERISAISPRPFGVEPSRDGGFDPATVQQGDSVCRPWRYNL